MQKYIKYKKEKTYVIDREDFHRHLRNAEAELNMPNGSAYVRSVSEFVICYSFNCKYGNCLS